MRMSRLRRSRSLPSLTDRQFAYLLVLPLVIFAVVIVAYPLGYAFWLSMNSINFITRKFTFIGLQNYVTALQDPDTLFFTVVTLRFTFDVTILTLLGGLGVALLLNESFKGRAVLRVIVLLPWAVSEYATGVVWRYLFSEQLGFFNAALYTLGIIKEYNVILTPEFAIDFVAIAYTWHFMPLVTFFLLAGLQTVPEDLYRQARVDGAGPYRRFINIVLPHLKYAILISLVLATMEAARATDIIILLTGGGPGIASETLTYHIYRTSFRELHLGSGSAYSFLLLAIIIIIALSYFGALTKRRR